MRILAMLPRLCAAVLVALLACGQAHAQATRTWVSGVGDDANPCSRTAPCKTFAGAISKTAAGGVIDVLDPGGFGAVTITKSITLENVAAIAGIVVAGTPGVTVNGAGAVVTLRGLSFDGLGLSTSSPGTFGINFIQGSQLVVERCDINAFSDPTNGIGIRFAPTTTATLVVRDTTLHNNGNTGSPGTTGAISIVPTSSGSAYAVLEDVRISNSGGFGLLVQGPASVVVRDSGASMNSGNGFSALASSATVSLTLDRVVANGNSVNGVVAQGAAASIRVSDSTITANTQGIRAIGGGAVVSFGNNRNLGNIINGAPTATSPLQ